MPFSTINPYTGETIKTFADATDSEIAAAITRADETFKQWRELSITERVPVLQKAADILREKKTAFAKIITLEMGKILAEAEAEVELSAAIFEYYVKNAAVCR